MSRSDGIVAGGTTTTAERFRTAVFCAFVPGTCVSAALNEGATRARAAGAESANRVAAGVANAASGASGLVTAASEGVRGIVTAAAEPVAETASAARVVSVSVAVGIVALVVLGLVILVRTW